MIMNLRVPLLVALSLVASACSTRTEPDSSAGAATIAQGATAGMPRMAMARPSLAHRFAALPDRGALVRYPAQPVVRHDGAYTWHRADLSEAHARSAVGSVLAMTSPSGESLRFRYSRHVEHPNGDWTWVGSSVEDPNREAIITFGDKAAFGSIGQPGKEPLRLTMANGMSWLVETDPRQIAGIVNTATRPTRPDFFVAPEVADAVARRKAASGPSMEAAGISTTAAATTASGTTVDVVIGYTNGFVAGLGGESQAQTRLNFLVDVTNEAYVNSQVNANVRLVKTVLVNYPDATSNSSALEELTGFKAPSTQTTPNAAFSALRAARDQYGADLVSLVRKFNDPENDGCGIAWLIGGARSGIDQSDQFFGYSVVSDGRDAGTDGKTYFCRDETFAHELGHNMGSAHDRDTSDGDDNVLRSNEYGVYDYSFGYKTTAVAGNFYTIMAYGDSGQTRYRVFSNPRINTCGGYACGIANQADNARSLSQTIPTVAVFRATVVVENPGTSAARLGDGNADGRADIFWHGPLAQQFQPWYMNGASWSYGAAPGISNQYRIGAIGDFNGDRRADVLWFDNARTTLWAWLANADGSYAIAYLRSYPTGWEPVGVGDANADGRSDIYWHSPTQQGMQVWLMSGASWTYGPVSAIDSQYRIAAIGDFNGDGLSDLLWRDIANTTLWQWQAQAAGGYGVLYMRDYPQGWSIVGSGDVNGDGRADVLWHNPVQQGVQPWLMQGASWVYGSVRSIASQYAVASTGDFNGDGRMDVLWTDAGSVWTWLADATGSYSVAYLRAYPSGWSVYNPSTVHYTGN